MTKEGNWYDIEEEIKVKNAILMSMKLALNSLESRESL